MTRVTSTSLLKMGLIATLSLSLSIAPVSADPRHHRDRSDQSDTATFIAALLGLATLGVILSNKDKDHKRQPAPYIPPKPHKPVAKQPPQIHPSKLLPNRCLKSFNTQFGAAQYWGERCLKKRFKYSGQLPSSCRDTIVVRDRQGRYVTRDVYEPTCMRYQGYRIKKS